MTITSGKQVVANDDDSYDVYKQSINFLIVPVREDDSNIYSNNSVVSLSDLTIVLFEILF